MKFINILQKIITIVLLAFCLKEFVFILKKVLNQDSFQAIDEQKHTSLKAPVVTFCIGTAWKFSGIPLTHERFLQNQYSWEEIFHPKTLKAFRDPQRFKIHKTYASYYGMCFTIEKLVPEDIFDYSFLIVLNNSHDYIYYLHEAGEENHLFMGDYPYRVELKYIDANNYNGVGGSSIIYEKELVRKIPGKGGCQEKSMFEYIQCIRSGIANSMAKVSIHCKVAMMLYTDFDVSHLEYCNNSNDALAMEGLIFRFSQENHKKALCGSLCNRTIYNSVLTYVGEPALHREIGEYGEGYYILWAFYSSLYVNEKIETYVFDFDSALVAVGGSLGLFLGWSINSIISDFIGIIYGKLGSKKLGKVEETKQNRMKRGK